jgi:hypothetical protein
VPSEVRYGYSLGEALDQIECSMECGDEIMIGDLDRGVLFQVAYHNPKVIEAHVMGNALQLRSVARECLADMWNSGVEQVIVMTRFKALASIVMRMGFEQRGYLPRSHLVDGKLFDVWIYCMERSK